jgi:PAS domain-containing protein
VKPEKAICSVEGTEDKRRSDSDGDNFAAYFKMSDDRSTESVLQQTEEQFHILVESVGEYAIYMLDPTGNVVTWNSGAQKILAGK